MKYTEKIGIIQGSGGRFFVVGHNLYKIVGKFIIQVSNYHLRIRSQAIVIDDEVPEGRCYEIVFVSQGQEIPFSISCEDFLTRKLLVKIAETGGSSAILFTSLKDLQTGCQEISGQPPVKSVRSRGLTPEGFYVCETMVISPSGIRAENTGVIPRAGNYSRSLGFLFPDESKLPELGKHILDDFLELKTHQITYPLLGHVALAPFASLIGKFWGKEKPALHCEGPSGTGKSFLAGLCQDFFGNFNGRLPSWKGTPNSIEVEGFQFRDALFVLDDFKASITPHQTGVRVFQGYSGEQGRDRLNPASRLLKTPYIRGLLLSNGESFPSDIESVTGRVTRLRVDGEKNLEAGRRCQQYSPYYRMILPALIQMALSQPEWKEKSKQIIEGFVDSYLKEVQGLSNGLRVAGSWALNALGFWFFISCLENLNVLEKERKMEILSEYDGIVRGHLEEQTKALQLESPVQIFFRVLTEKLALGRISIVGLGGEAQKPQGKLIGMVKDKTVKLFPDAVVELLTEHYRAIDQRLPFTKNALRDALARDGLITQSGEGRWGVQFRGSGGVRYVGWSFDLGAFKARIEV